MDINGEMFTPEQKRQAVENGDNVFFTHGGTIRTAQMHAHDVMEKSSSKYWVDLDLNPEWPGNPAARHTMWIRPGEAPPDYQLDKFAARYMAPPL